MRIGIDASRAFLRDRTGIEEYAYRTIEHLREELSGHQVVLYVRKTANLLLVIRGGKTKINDLELPESWNVKVIGWPRFWTQVGLSLEMLLHPVDALFVPAHTVPWIHPENTVVTVHGLEYEFCPQAYSAFERWYMRLSIRNSCRWARKIISVSRNTKNDLVRLYGVSENKIEVIYEGYDIEKTETYALAAKRPVAGGISICGMQDAKYLLFVGRIEERKNIANTVKAFEILKEKYRIPHKLVLAGKPGYGYGDIASRISSSLFKDDIVELGFVSEEKKPELLKNADAFIFPTLYEGFGLPVLEAQSMGCPVVAANNSSIPEVAGDAALLVDPENPEEIAEAIKRLISDKKLKNDIMEKGLENIKRFSWGRCARESAALLRRPVHALPEKNHGN